MLTMLTVLRGRTCCGRFTATGGGGRVSVRWARCVDPAGECLPGRVNPRDRLLAERVRTMTDDRYPVPAQLLIAFTESMTLVCNAAGSGAAPSEARVACPSVAV